MAKAERKTQKKKNGPTKKIRTVAARTRADKVLAQGVGKAAVRPFGGIDTMSKQSWDAFHPAHAPLPRSVGPYAVVRTTGKINSNNSLMMFGTFCTHNDSSRPLWSNICAIGSVNPAGQVNAAGNTQYYTVGAPSSTTGGPTSSFTCVPAAISVQLMNPGALQTTSGIMEAAACPAQLALGGNTITYNGVAQQFISYFKPRLMSAGKLALRGVQVDSYPLSMADISQFRDCAIFPTSNDSASAPAIEWLGSTAGTIGVNSLTPMGWAPIVVHNPQTQPLEFLVTIEWRVRFDISNPAVSSHKHHGVSTDKAWDDGIKRAVNLGHGVMDIAERVANYGAAIAPYVRRGQQMMLLDG